MPKKNGRPTIFTQEVIDKLEHAFLLGCTDREACLYAGIGESTLYQYQEKNPEFTERKHLLKENPVLLSRETVMRGLKRDPKLAFDYLKARKRDEFADRQELTGKDGNPIQFQTLADLVVEAASTNDATDQDTSPSSS